MFDTEQQSDKSRLWLLRLSTAYLDGMMQCLACLQTWLAIFFLKFRNYGGTCVCNGLLYAQAAFMASCCGIGSWLDMAANVATRPPSIDRIVSTTGCKDRSVPLRYHMCTRLSRAGRSYKHGKGRRQVCNSAEPDWDAEMSLFRKRSMKPNQMQTIRRLEEEVDIGKVTI